VIERKYIGDACPNIACLPGKHIIHTAQVASYVWRSDEFGIARDGFRIDMSAVCERKRKMVSGLIEIPLEEFRKSGADFIMGSARFVGPKTLEAILSDGGRRLLRGKNVIIGTGTHAALDPIPGLAEAQSSIYSTGSAVSSHGPLALGRPRATYRDGGSPRGGGTRCVHSTAISPGSEPSRP
jgi:pyruvate/2-oxoglutarate dehydrogenase complex dihydrolipoamide dehydrogenase (E3) component